MWLINEFVKKTVVKRYERWASTSVIGSELCLIATHLPMLYDNSHDSLPQH